MRKLLKKPWFVALLAIAAVIFVVSSLPSHRTLAPAPTVVADEPQSDAIPTEAEQTGASRRPLSIRNALKELSAASVLRDPFAYRTTTAATSTEKPVEPDLTDYVVVSAVWIQGGTAYVLINNHVYRVGDHVGRITLESANRDGVWVRHWKGRDFVAVGGDFTLTTPARQAAAALSLSSES